MTPSVPRVAVIVVAAGDGTRLNAGVPKAFALLGGKSILHHALQRICRAAVVQVIVVAPESHLADASQQAHELCAGRDLSVTIVSGGVERTDSVRRGLAGLASDIDTVLVHDAARALTPPEVFTRVAEAVRDSGHGVVPVLSAVDTLATITGGRLIGSLDRDTVAVVQTPQGFPRVQIESAYAQASGVFTDDASVARAVGIPVGSVPGHPEAFKITTQADLDRARALLPPSDMAFRVGIGTDAHAFGGDGALWLAGLEWPEEKALSGHSDGDAVAHAIVDALLSAAGLGDIGTHFGTDRPEFAGAHADVFLSGTRELLAAAGWRVGNVSVQLQANRPRFAARRTEAETVLSAALDGAPVTVAATSTDGLGFPGRGEGVAAFAIALVLPA